MSDKKRVAIFISGRGSNMSALIQVAKSSDYPAEIVGIISNKASAEGLVTAGQNNIPTAIFSLKDYADKATTDAAIDAQLVDWNVDIICLAGFMRLLGADFCAKWQGNAINIHPSLLPEFKGLDTHRRALDADAGEHGCTVHFVTTDVDDGPIIGQVAVPVEYGDTVSLLEERVRKAEHKLYPWALAQVASGEINFDSNNQNN